MNLSDVCLPVFRHMLGNLRHCLDKTAADAQARNYDPAVLVNYRLAPDMLPFKAQVFIACDAAKLCCVRVGGLEAPVFEDKADTLDELKARIDATLAWLATVSPAAIDGAADRDVSFKAGPATRTRTCAARGRSQLALARRWRRRRHLCRRRPDAPGHRHRRQGRRSGTRSGGRCGRLQRQRPHRLRRTHHHQA